MKVICVTNLTVRRTNQTAATSNNQHFPGRRNWGGRHVLFSRIPIPVLRQIAQAWAVKASILGVVAMLLADIFLDCEPRNMTSLD